MSAALYPVFLKLRGREALLVGGGAVAAAKLQGLLAAGARVTVVAPQVRPEIAARPVRLRRRPFEPRDLEGAWYVVAAAPLAVNRAVAAAAERRRVFVNAADDPRSASAYLGAVVRRAGLLLAVSTQGTAPALAALLGEGFAALLPPEVGDWRRLAGRLRARWKAAATPLPWRRPLLLDALNRVYAERERATLEARA